MITKLKISGLLFEFVDKRMPIGHELSTFLFILVVSSLLLFWNLGRNALANWDEAWYADGSRFMFRNDHFFTPIWNNQYFFDKPPLQYWLTQPFLWIFGEKELAYRLPSAIASVVLTLLVYQWGKSRNGISGGLIAAFVLLSFPHFLDRSRSGNFDALFTMWTTFSLWLFIKKKPIFGGIVLGLAWLIKGAFSGFFPIVMTALFLMHDIFRFRSFRLLLPFGLFTLTPLLIYAPWHFLELTRFERLIDNSYFATFDQGTFGSWNWMEIVDRFNLRYLVFLWTFLRWWFPVTLAAIAWSLWRLVKRDPNIRMHPNDPNIEFIPIVTFLVIFFTLSAAREKNDWYLMPTYPFIALMISDFTHHMFLVVIPRLISDSKVLTQKLTKSFRTRSGIYMDPSSSAGMTSRFPIRSGMIAMLMFVILSISLSNLNLYRKQAFPPNKHLVEKEVAEFVKNHTAPDDLIVTAEYEFPTLRYYSERETRTAASQPDFQGKYWWIWDNVDIETALRRGRKIVVITRPGAEWPVDVWGYRRERIGEINGRTISRVVAN